MPRGVEPTCPNCGAYLDGSRLHDDLGVCDDCWFTCEMCLRAVHLDQQEHEVLGHEGCTICEDCVFWCYECDRAVSGDEDDHMNDYHPDDEFEDEYDEVTVPNSSRDVSEDRSMMILNYSYKPEPIFFISGPDDPAHESKLYFGVEHEMEFPRLGTLTALREGGRPRDQALKAIYPHNEALGQPFYCKSDGSIHHGFEMVSHPFSRAWFDQSYPEDMLIQLQMLGASPKADEEGYDTCGIHVHVSLAAFTSYHLYKFMHFHYEFAGLVQRVAGRTGSDYASFNRDELGYALRMDKDGQIKRSQAAKMRAIAKKEDSNSNRYMAVNMQNSATAELRYFRSTAKIERLRAYIQFVDAVYHYTKDARMSKKAKGKRIMSEADFLAWVRENEAKFPDLVQLFDRNEAYRPD